MADESFFAELPLLERFVEVPDPSWYRQAPASWALIITDVQGSTRAIEQGRYKDVNALGVASIVAVRNAMPDVDMPFVFGGDGATMLCPKSRLAQVEPALRGLQERATNAFDLGMRAGIVPIDRLLDAHHDVLVARYRASEHATFAMFAGSGLTEGERWVKDDARGDEFAVAPGDANADFTGFECRWEPVPSEKGEVVCILVQAVTADRKAAATVYKEVIARLEGILEGDGRPVGVERLKIAATANAYRTEAALKTGKGSGVGHSFTKIKTMALARMAKKAVENDVDGFIHGRYREEVTANTDFRKFDDTLRMVLDVTLAQKAAILEYLSEQHAAGRVVYGVHGAPSATMTCVITKREGDHVHFVDGSDGGYALAAKQMKAQLKARASRD